MRDIEVKSNIKKHKNISYLLKSKKLAKAQTIFDFVVQDIFLLSVKK